MNQERDIIMTFPENQLRNSYMRLALNEAKKAYKKGEVPVGAVIVCNGKVISKAHNTREKHQHVLTHAEVIAIKKASKKIGSWRLEDCELYVTLEPCLMCAGAIIQSRIKTVIYGTKDLKSGVASSIINVFELPLNHKVELVSGVLEEESSKLLQDFFKKLRNR